MADNLEDALRDSLAEDRPWMPEAILAREVVRLRSELAQAKADLAKKSCDHCYSKSLEARADRAEAELKASNREREALENHCCCDEPGHEDCKPTQEKIEEEQARWQDRINGILAPFGIDGSGCDSGDPLDLTATEVQMLANKLVESREANVESEKAAIAEIRRYRAMFSDIKRFSIPTIEDGENAVLIIKSAVARAEKAEDLRNRYKAAFLWWVGFLKAWRTRALKSEALAKEQEREIERMRKLFQRLNGTDLQYKELQRIVAEALTTEPAKEDGNNG